MIRSSDLWAMAGDPVMWALAVITTVAVLWALSKIDKENR